MHEKIKSLKDISKILDKYKKNGKKIVQCHGVFDLLHPGHIRHFKKAKAQGDKLVVSITPDMFVNKGPGRPAFNESLRLESIASLSFVDYVVLNDSADAINAIKVIKPDVYVKGKEYKDFDKDITKKIEKENEEVNKNGGKIYFTEDIVFSSSNLINKYIDPFTKQISGFLHEFKKKFSENIILKKIEDVKTLKVLVIGDAILDEYQTVDLLGQSGKGQHLAAVCREKELFLGGSLIIANHLAEFSDNVSLMCGIGKNCGNLSFIEEKLNKKINFMPIYYENLPTLIKKRYVTKDTNVLTKLFETYSSNENLLNLEQTKQIVNYLEVFSNDFDLILIADFGNGFINREIVNAFSKINTFIALNTQINSGNRGFNVITHYKKADFISVNEPELRLAAHDRKSSIQQVTTNISKKMNCSDICVTQGTNGVLGYSQNNFFNIPAFSLQALDRVGAGDSFFAISSLFMSKNNQLQLSAFLGSIASALKVQYIGNKYCIDKVAFVKFLTRLFK